MATQWYSEGLFSSDFTNITDMDLRMNPSWIINGESGVWNGFYRADDQWKNNANDPDFEPLDIKDMTRTGTEQIHVDGRTSSINRYGSAVSAQCEDAETAIAYIDWWYGDKGTLLNSYGVEGMTFEYNEDGQPLYTDLVLDNPKGSLRAMRNIYTGMSFSFRVLRVVTASYDNGYDIIDRCTWDSNRDNAWDISAYCAKTTEEGETYSALISDIETYINETILRFVLGEMDIETQWDEYVSEVKAMGVQTVIDITAASVERYEKR